MARPLTSAATIKRGSLDARDGVSESEALAVEAAGVAGGEDGGLVVVAAGAGEEIDGGEGGAFLEGTLVHFSQ